MVSRQIRENPPKEKPGGAPPQVAAMIAGGPPAGYGAPPPAYGAPVAAGRLQMTCIESTSCSH